MSPTNLYDLGIEEWREAFGRMTAATAKADAWYASAEGFSGGAVLPGPFAGWHLYALAIRRLLEANVEQQETIRRLESRVRTLERAVYEDPKPDD